MGDPLFKTQRNKRTGELRQLVSDDGGASWSVLQQGPQPVEASPAHPAAPSPQPEQPMSSMEMFAELGRRGINGLRDNVWNPAMLALGDAELGAAQGATWGAGDEISAMGDPQRLEEFRAKNEEARARSPWLYGGGQALGAGTVGLLTGPMSTALAGAGRAAPIAEAAIQGGTTAFNEANTDDLGDRALAAFGGAGISSALASLIPGLGKLASAVAPGANSLARRAQANAEGLTGPTFKALSKSHGLEQTRDELAQEALDTAPRHFIPQKADWFAEQRGLQRDAAGPAVDAAVGKLEQEVPQAISLDDLASRFTDARAPYASSIIDEEKALANSIDSTRNNLVDKYAGRRPIAAGGEMNEVPDVYLSPRDLQAEKVALASRGYPRNSTMSTSDADKASLYRELSGIPRTALREATQLATPGTQDEVAEAFSRYASADALADAAHRKAVADEGQPRAGLLSMLYGAAHDRAPDAASLAMQGAGAGLRGMDRFAQGLDQTPMSGMGMVGGLTAGGYMQDKSAREAIAGKSQGHNLESSIEEAMQQNPQALGPYAAKFQEAKQSGDPRRVTALIFELEEDPVWRTKYKPALSASNRQKGY